jgi:hypothetical protein
LQKRVLREKHPNTITAIADLALTWWQQGQSDKAELIIMIPSIRKRRLIYRRKRRFLEVGTRNIYMEAVTNGVGGRGVAQQTLKGHSDWDFKIPLATSLPVSVLVGYLLYYNCLCF